MWASIETRKVVCVMKVFQGPKSLLLFKVINHSAFCIMKYLQNTLREIIDFEIEFLTHHFFAAVAFLQSILFMQCQYKAMKPLDNKKLFYYQTRCKINIFSVLRQQDSNCNAAYIPSIYSLQCPCFKRLKKVYDTGVYCPFYHAPVK